MEKTSPSSRRVRGLPLAIIALTTVAAGALVVRGAAVTKPAAAPTPAPTIAGVPVAPGIVVTEAADPVLGATDAPQTIFLFTQWHCSFCRHFFEATFPQLKQKFIDTGQVRLVFKVFPIGDESQDIEQAQRVAEAAYCAHEQAAFWEYTRHLFALGAGYEVADLTRYADEEGLQKDRFVVCLEEQEYADVMANTIRAAVAAGVTATPAFVINDRLYEGALSFAELEEILR